MGTKKLKEFAEECHISFRDAQRYVQRHEEALAGHIERYGAPRGTYLDEYAQEYLLDKLAVRKIEVLDTRQAEEIARLQMELEEAQKKILTLTEKLAAVLEDKADLTQRALQAENTLALSEATVATKDDQLQQLQDQVSKLKSRTLWQRITRFGE